MLFQQLSTPKRCQEAPDGAFCRFSALGLRASFGRTVPAALVFLWLVVCWGAVYAQQAGSGSESERMLLVVVPASLEVNSLRVDRYVDLIKLERERRRHAPAELPILRLSQGDPEHQKVLRLLGLRADDELRTYTCARDARGWPLKVLQAHQAGTPAELILDESVRAAPEVNIEAEARIGVLLVGRAEDRKLLDAFLQELGSFWLSRYGRVRPSPYPLASYDLDDPDVATSLESVFPELAQEPPLVALCHFEGEQPSQLLKLYRGLDTPATLVRELSAARARAVELSSGLSGVAPAAPSPQLVGLTAEQERALLVSRLSETARQLWSAAESDERRANQPAKRLLLKVIEECRRYLEQEDGAWLALQESLRDYAVEPLISDEPRLAEAQARFLLLGKTLLAAP